MARVAVLIDAENIGAEHGAAVLTCAERLGDVVVARLYADFSSPAFAAWLGLAHRSSLQPVFQPSGGKGKNSADIALTIDAMDILLTTPIESFLLVSNDRDFVPLATRLRAAGRRVYVMCRQVDPRMSAVCTGVFSIAPTPEPPIVAACRQIAGDQTEVSLPALGKQLREHAPQLLPGGKGGLRKSLLATGYFEETGPASSQKLRLVRR